ncbi:MAG: class I SAM-dependent RNA methyltransferase [Xanthobacteraceae bacterium]|nr:class I SAM-dependent RNA methyltransferase [Xanthobacteraceae bacterium]
MIERLIVTHLGHRGDGVADGEAGPIYVPCTLPGETVEVEAWPGHPDRRQLLRVASASAERIAPICPHFGVCGGCALQHWNRTEYRAWKRDLVRTALQQAGLDAPVDDLIDAHGEGRRRAVFHARSGTHGVLAVGFAAAHQHHIVPIDRCPILAPGLDGALAAAWAIAQELEPIKKPLDIAVTATEAGLDIDVRGSGPLQPRLGSALAAVAERHRVARLTRHGELVARRATPTITMGRTRVELAPGAFLQATAEGEAALARSVVGNLGKPKLVVDLFCGLGPFALRIAEATRVIAADTDADAIAALAKAARTPGLRPIEATARDLFRRPFVAEELRGADVVVFDPPRQGAQAQARALATSKVPLVIAVSCNPATFARDAKILVDAGYKLKAVTPIDQFRYSSHVEIVARLER